MIKKFWKIFLIAFFVLAIVGFWVSGWWQKDQQSVIAQNFGTVGSTKIICEEPIPIGIAIDNTVDILDQVYQAYKNEGGKTAKETIESLTRIINEKGEGKVCDFDGQCNANIANAGPNLDAMAKALPGVKLEKKISIATNMPPICEVMGDKNVNKNNCVGNPCPSLSQFIKKPREGVPNGTLEGFKDALTTQADNIHALFDGKNKVVIAAIAEKGESPGVTKISDVDFVKRYINYIDEAWLTPNPQGNACVLSKLERERVVQGTMGEKYPKSCLSALADMTYSPKPWSEECVDECASGDLSDECRACLGQCKGDSVFARINCKLYSKGGGQNEESSSCNYNNATLCGEDSQCVWGQNPNERATKINVCATKQAPGETENKTCGDCSDNETKCREGCSEEEERVGQIGGGCEWKSVDVSVPSTCYAKVQLPLGTDENPKCAIIEGASKKCCGNECEDGLNAACYACLCPKGKNEATTEQCLDWICGGSKSNWVCCHEQPIESPLYYVADDTTEPDAIGVTKTGDPVDGIYLKTKTSAYVDNIQKTTSGVSVQMGVMAATSKMPFGTCVRITKIKEGEKGPSNKYDPGVFDFADDYILKDTHKEKKNEYFCITDHGGDKIESGERMDIWLDKNADYYTSRKMASGEEFEDQWGVRNTDLVYWYDPEKPCTAGKTWKDRKLDLGVCNFEKENEFTQDKANAGISIPQGGFEHLRMGWGKGDQWGDASEPLKKLLECVNNELKDTLTSSEYALISSISDSAGMQDCGNANTYNKACAHNGADSCHYGGVQSRKVKSTFLGDYKSVAADISKTRSSSPEVALKAAQAAACCGSFGGYQTTAMEESDHYHIGVAVKNTTLLGKVVPGFYEVGMLADKKDKNYYDCDKGFRTSPEQVGNVISCPTN